MTTKKNNLSRRRSSEHRVVLLNLRRRKGREEDGVGRRIKKRTVLVSLGPMWVVCWSVLEQSRSWAVQLNTWHGSCWKEGGIDYVDQRRQTGPAHEFLFSDNEHVYWVSMFALQTTNQTVFKYSTATSTPPHNATDFSTLSPHFTGCKKKNICDSHTQNSICNRPTCNTTYNWIVSPKLRVPHICTYIKYPKLPHNFHVISLYPNPYPNTYE